VFSNHVAYIKRARVVNNVILPRLSKLAGRGGRRMMTAKDICQPCVRSLAKVEVRNPLPLAQRKQPTFTQLHPKSRDLQPHSYLYRALSKLRETPRP
jgi:hypothetical protein